MIDFQIYSHIFSKHFVTSCNWLGNYLNCWIYWSEGHSVIVAFITVVGETVILNALTISKHVNVIYILNTGYFNGQVF